MVLVSIHPTLSTLLGTNTGARWLGLSGVFIAMVRGNYFGNFDNDDNCNDNDDKDGNGSYSVCSLVWPRTEEQITGNMASQIFKKPSKH